MNTIAEILKSGNATIVDVRTPAEYAGGHVANSINIPLNTLPAHLDECKGMDNIVVCCASGIRSQNAAIFLKQHGINCWDGGSWFNVNNYVNNN